MAAAATLHYTSGCSRNSTCTRRRIASSRMADTSGQGTGQRRIGIERRGGTKFPGNILQRTTFRTVFIGGLVAAGLGWFMFSREPLASKLQPMTSKVETASRGGSKVPRVPTMMDKVEHPEGPTYSVSPKFTNPYSGMVSVHSEGLKPRP